MEYESFILTFHLSFASNFSPQQALNRHHIIGSSDEYNMKAIVSLLLPLCFIVTLQAQEFSSLPPEATELDAHYECETFFDRTGNPVTEIDYALATDSHVRLTVYDLFGRRIATLSDKHTAAGKHSITFNGSGLHAGVYFFRLDVAGKSITKRMVITR